MVTLGTERKWRDSEGITKDQYDGVQNNGIMNKK